MGKPKHYWYGTVRTMILNYDNLRKDNSERAVQFLRAIEIANEETLKLDNGTLRMKAVNDILYRKVRNAEGEALYLYYGKRTIEKWISNYVNLVGKKAGF